MYEIKNCNLFNDIIHNDLSSVLSCLNAKTYAVQKNEFILSIGEKPEYIGIILEGNLQIIKEDINGERIIVDSLVPGDLFAEALCFSGISESPVSIVAINDSKIMLLAFNKIVHTCQNSCSFHTKLIENMLSIISQKNIFLQQRLDIIGKKTLRNKVLNYLELQNIKDNNITIPFNREQLADFLCVDRSALSHELSRMKKNGLIDYYKNTFKLFSIK